MKSVAPREITMGQVYRAVTPYVLFGLLMLAVVWLAPSVATGLPRLLFGK